MAQNTCWLGRKEPFGVSVERQGLPSRERAVLQRGGSYGRWGYGAGAGTPRSQRKEQRLAFSREPAARNRAGFATR